jgi:hypothetical protein
VEFLGEAHPANYCRKRGALANSNSFDAKTQNGTAAKLKTAKARRNAFLALL